MNKLMQIVRREYLETVKTKAFIIGVLIVPVMVTMAAVLSGKMQKEVFTGPREDRNVAVINQEQVVDSSLRDMFEQYNKDNQARRIVPHFIDMDEEQGKSAVLDGDFDALLLVQSEIVSGDGHAKLFTRPSSDISLQPLVRRIVSQSVTNVRYEQNGLSPELVRKLGRGVWVEDVQLSDQGESRSNRVANMLLPAVFLMLIFFGVITSSQGLLNSVIEEKSNRVIEVLLSAVSPLEMMAGKVLGQSAIGLTLVAIYVLGGIAALYITGYEHVLSRIGGAEIAVLVPYFLLAFVLFNSMFAAVGSAFNSLKEAQSMMTPLMLVIILPMMLQSVIIQQPQHPLVVAASLVPPFSPLVMVMRVTAMPQMPLLEVIASLILLAAAVLAVVWAAARIFRVGILMYGKPPSLREIVRWVRQA